jgi:hypothetical protein
MLEIKKYSAIAITNRYFLTKGENFKLVRHKGTGSNQTSVISLFKHILNITFILGMILIVIKVYHNLFDIIKL